MNHEEELTCPAKVAIRGYMLKLVAVPGIALTVISFVLGYMVNDVAKEKAYTEAYAAASSTIVSLTVDASRAAEDAADIQEKTKSQLEEAEKIKATIETTKAFQSSEENKKQIAALLRKDSEFKNLVTKRPKLECKALPTEEKNRYKSCDSGYYQLVRWCSGDCGGDDARVTICCKD